MAGGEAIFSEQKALHDKEKGNQAFKDGKFEEAIRMYSQAIECDQTQPVLYCNRAMAYLKLSRFYEAKLDCDQALKLDPTYVKAYFRRGLANTSLNDFDRALRDFEQVLKLEPNNKEAKKEMNKIEKAAQNTDKNSRHIEVLDEEAKKLVPSSPLRKVDVTQIGSDKQQTELCSASPSKNASTKHAEKKGGRSSSSLASAAVISKLASSIANEDQKSISSLMSSMILDTPKSAFQFLNGWRTLKSDSKKFCFYLLKIPVSTYINVIDSCLEPDLISDMLTAYSEHGFATSSSSTKHVDNENGQQENGNDRSSVIYDSLLKLTTLKNFRTSKLFFDEKDIAKLDVIVDHLKADGCVKEDDLNELRKLYAA